MFILNYKKTNFVNKLIFLTIKNMFSYSLTVWWKKWFFTIIISILSCHIKKIEIDHVGLSSDFYGRGGLKGWWDTLETFNIPLGLVNSGWTEEGISKIWSVYLLRILDKVQEISYEV